MNIKTLEIAGIASALEAVHLPYTDEVKSEAHARFAVHSDQFHDFFESKSECIIEQSDMKLLKRLRTNGDEHAKVLRGVVVWVKITAPMDWWCELETYRAGHERLSSSSKMHTIYKGLRGDALKDARDNTPATFPLTKVDFFSYQSLQNICGQRYNHANEEWHQFQEWVKTLPFYEELIKPVDRKAIHLEQFINKACKWLETIMYNEKNVVTCDYETVQEFLSDFRKYMKGGEQ